MNFHRRLKARREALRISIRKICKDLLVPKSTYEMWEVDSFPRHPLQYLKLARYLRVSPEHLMFGTEARQELEEVFVHLEKFIDFVVEKKLKQTATNPKK